MNGTLVVEVDLDIYNEKRGTWYPNLDIPIINDLFMDRHESNVTFSCEGREFPAHRYILAKC